MVATVVLMTGADEGGDDQQLTRLPLALSLSFFVDDNKAKENVVVGLRCGSVERKWRETVVRLMECAGGEMKCNPAEGKC